MAKNPKTKRTAIKDMAVAEKNMTQEEMEKLQGGGKSKPGYDVIVKEPPQCSIHKMSLACCPCKKQQ